MKSFKYAVYLSVYLLIVWGFYRFLFQLPEIIEELFIKPIVWLVPVFYLLWKEKEKVSSLGITVKNLFPAVYYALGLGAFFVMEALIINFVKYGGKFNLGANLGELPFLTSLGLSFATAISEELTFRGYIFTRIWKVLGSELYSNLVTSLFWALIHVPITFFVWKLDLGAALIYLFLTTLFGVGSAFVYARTKNILSPILLHVLWQWPIILFR
ncbi:MAG TPA: type II CAAX endopeptidase family protein [Patescibacteria group bacterium]|nr:type II CAAX endopeptidase family protein [Patescibacteria group bacterium]